MISKRLREFVGAISHCSYQSQEKELAPWSALCLMQTLLLQTKESEGIVYVIGNGGSSGIASHFSNDLFKVRQISSQTLYDSNLVTCLGNDLGYEQIFSYPLERLLKKEDLLVAMSSSGASKNILNAAQVALKRKSPLITLSGFSPKNPLRQLGELNFWIDQSDYGPVETAHFFLLHAVIDLWDSMKKQEEKNGKPFAKLSPSQNQICLSD